MVEINICALCGKTHSKYAIISKKSGVKAKPRTTCSKECTALLLRELHWTSYKLDMKNEDDVNWVMDMLNHPEKEITVEKIKQKDHKDYEIENDN